jgi:hypothetical protein
MDEDSVKDAFVKLRLDIQAASMLCQDNEQFRKFVRNELLLSVDPDIQRFIESTKGEGMSTFGMLGVAGNMVLASIFLFFGILFATPLVTGFTQQAFLQDFFARILSIMLRGTSSQPLAVVEDAVISFTLIFSALYIVRYSSKLVKRKVV